MLVKSPIHKSFLGLVHYLKLEVVYAFAISSLIYYLYDRHDLSFLESFSFIPVGFFGAILSVFLAFRNNNSYGRWWEARQLWGDLVNASRAWGSQVMALVGAPNPEYSSQREAKIIYVLQHELIHRHLACINLMRMQLRQDVEFRQVQFFLSSEDMVRTKASINPATQMLSVQAQRLKQIFQQGYLSDFQQIAMQNTLDRFFNILGACERIKNTPFPREYDGFIRLMIWIQISIMPVYFLGIFSDNLSKILIIPSTVAVTLIIGFANKAGEIMEDPFENRVHDIPMTALCNTIERDLKQQLGSTQIPEKTLVVDDVVW